MLLQGRLRMRDTTTPKQRAKLQENAAAWQSIKPDRVAISVTCIASRTVCGQVVQFLFLHATCLRATFHVTPQAVCLALDAANVALRQRNKAGRLPYLMPRRKLCQHEVALHAHEWRLLCEPSSYIASQGETSNRPETVSDAPHLCSISGIGRFGR
ncbi:hypothetical protein OH76DRAFT_324978 [Lentinus brumalis]|uniref:Uncharacterized protein n=1 Tax=Lentinus brumalis TaxID=2498619 RepID=A0A371DFN6_9APHY|nr:hypothetical protein OH76DRAFT_324978 [Polyporus brumalis]